jgi:Flp pilus assembly protein TadG
MRHGREQAPGAISFLASFRAFLGGISHFFRMRDAASAIEFAMLAPAFVMLVVETLQAGLYFYTSAALDHAAGIAARQVLTGQVSSSGLTANTFRQNVLCPQLPGGMSCSNVITNMQNVPEALAPNGFYAFVNANQTAVITPAMNNTQTSFCPGIAGNYIYLQIYYAMPVISPIWYAMSTSWNGANVHFVSDAFAFKNEPFQSSTQAGC